MLVPRPLRGIVRPTPFGAIFARESRYWWRDPRRRASLLSIVMACAVVPLVLGYFGPGEGWPSGFVTVISTLVGTMCGMLLANQLAYDGNANAAHLLSHVPGRVELRARAAAITVVAAPVQLAVIVFLGVVAPDSLHPATALGILAGSYGAAVAAAAVVSVLAPYPLPDSPNPFAVNAGGSSAKGLLALVAMLAALVLAMPVIVAGGFLNGPSGGPWVVLALGLGYGVVAAWLGTLIAGDVLDRRAPEILAAVTPRR